MMWSTKSFIVKTFCLLSCLPVNLFSTDAISQVNAIFSTYMNYTNGTVETFIANQPLTIAPSDVQRLTSLCTAIDAAAKAITPTDPTKLNNLQIAFWNGIMIPVAAAIPPVNESNPVNCNLFKVLYNASKSLCLPSCNLITGPLADPLQASMKYQLGDPSAGFIVSLNIPESITQTSKQVSFSKKPQKKYTSKQKRPRITNKKTLHPIKAHKKQPNKNRAHKR